MAKKKETRQGYSRILDAWTPPITASRPVACISTTFTLDTAFFEEDCLGRFLRMETNAEDHGVGYLIEREEKLAAAYCCLLVDSKNNRGKRSPRWDLIPIDIFGAVQHAKVSIIHWEGHIRIIVASANATEVGFCENLEVFGVLDFFEGGACPIQVLTDVASFLRIVMSKSSASQEALLRSQGALLKMEEEAKSWHLPESFGPKDSIQVYFVAIHPEAASLFEQLAAHWPENVNPHSAVVTSPFFDGESPTNVPAMKLWELMRSRGESKVSYQLRSEPGGDGKTVIFGPRSLLTQKPIRRSAEVEVVGFSTTSTDSKLKPVFRSLHAKSIYLEGNRWSVTMIGSSNFTSKGCGLDRHSNLEGNLVYVLDHQVEPDAAKHLVMSLPSGGERPSTDQIIWFQDKDECESKYEDGPVLHKAFKTATFFRSIDGRNMVRLTFSTSLPESWSVHPEGGKEALIDTAGWLSSGSPSTVEVSWPMGWPPSGLDVFTVEESRPAWWTVNIACDHDLPPPEELKNLPLDVLLEILSSSAPVYRIIMRTIERSNEVARFAGDLSLDAHFRVNTTSFLLQRTRKISDALLTLRRNLERPFATSGALKWRFRSAVGVDAVVKAIKLESKSRSLEELVFLLAEVALELSRVRPSTTGFGPSIEEVKTEIAAAIERIRIEIESYDLPDDSRVKSYVFAALKEAV